MCNNSQVPSIPEFNQPNDAYTWSRLQMIAPEDFDQLHIKRPDCSEFKTLEAWFQYFLEHLRSLDHKYLFASKFNCSPRQYIQYYSRISRGEIKE